MRINMVGEVDILDRDTRNLGYVRPRFYQYAIWSDGTGTGTPTLRNVTTPANFIYIVHAARAFLTTDVNVANRVIVFTVTGPGAPNEIVRETAAIVASSTGLMEVGPVTPGGVPAATVEIYLKTDPPGIAIPTGSTYFFNITNVQAGDVWVYAETVLRVPVP